MRGVYVQRFDVPPDAIDVNGHVNNLAYLGWMQDIATAHSSACGWPLERYLETRTSWVVRSHHIEYERPAFAGESLTDVDARLRCALVTAPLRVRAR